MIDRLLVDLDLLKSDEELGEKVKLAMISGAESFLRAGGVVNWEFWSSLSGESRDAFILANEKVKKEFVALQALANHSREFAIELMAQTDGGDIKMYMELASVLDKAEGKLKSISGDKVALGNK